MAVARGLERYAAARTARVHHGSADRPSWVPYVVMMAKQLSSGQKHRVSWRGYCTTQEVDRLASLEHECQQRCGGEAVPEVSAVAKADAEVVFAPAEQAVVVGKQVVQRLANTPHYLFQLNPDDEATSANATALVPEMSSVDQWPAAKAA